MCTIWESLAKKVYLCYTWIRSIVLWFFPCISITIYECVCLSVSPFAYAFLKTRCVQKSNQEIKNQKKTRFRKTKLYWKRFFSIYLKAITQFNHGIHKLSADQFSLHTIVRTMCFGNKNCVSKFTLTKSKNINFLDTIVVEQCVCVWMWDELKCLKNSEFHWLYDTEENISNPTKNYFNQRWELRSSYIQTRIKTIDRKIRKTLIFWNTQSSFDSINLTDVSQTTHNQRQIEPRIRSRRKSERKQN